MTFHEILVPLLSSTMPILLLFTTHYLRGKPAQETQVKAETDIVIENQIQQIVKELEEQKGKIATIEETLKNILNGRF